MNPHSVMASFSENVGRVGKKAAIEWQNERISYEELDSRAKAVADGLIRSGAKAGDLVVVALENRVWTITALLGIWNAGCVFVPLDLSNPPKRLEAMLSVVEPHWILTQASVATALDKVHLPLLPDHVLLIEAQLCESDCSGSKSATVRAETLGPDDMCYLCFTSGSSGTPKAIAGRFKSVAHFIEWEARAFAVDEGCRVSQFTSPVYDAFFRDVFLPLSTGGTICVPDSREMLLDAEQLIRWIDQRHISLIHCVPSLFRTILSEKSAVSPGFRELRHVLLAGEAVFPADVNKWIEMFGERIELVNLYGPTETTMIKLFHRIRRRDLERKSIPIGKPIDGARALIVSADGNVCPPNFVGEIYIRTPYSSLGYYNRPELTREVFVPNPFGSDPNDIVYRTGDLGRMLSDGIFEFCGRNDSQLKMRGVRVELGEIESVLRMQEGVQEAVVVLVQGISDDPYLCAYVVAKPDLKVEAVHEHLAAHLPIHLVPPVIIHLESLPRTENGKVDRKALPPPEKQPREHTPYSAPTSLTEKQLVSIWGGLLAIERVGVNDDFFELGGHSLLATQLKARIRTVFQVEVPLGALFENPTIASLASIVERLQIETADQGVLAEILEEFDNSPENYNHTLTAGAGATDGGIPRGRLGEK